MKINLFIIIGLLSLSSCKKETEEEVTYQDYKLQLTSDNNITDTAGKKIRFSFDLTYNNAPYTLEPFNNISGKLRYLNTLTYEQLYFNYLPTGTGKLDVFISIPWLSQQVEVEFYLSYQNTPITTPIKLTLRQKPDVQTEWTAIKLNSFSSMLELPNQTYCYHTYNDGIVFSNKTLDSAWKISNYKSMDYSFVFIGKTSTGKILAKNATNRLYISTDNGASFERTFTNLPYLSSAYLIDDLLFAVSNNPQNISNANSLYVSNNEGSSWQELNKGYSIVNLKKLTNEKLVFVTKDNQVYTMNKNTDAPVNITPPGTTVSFMEVFENNIYILSNKNEIFKSTDQGLNWVNVGTISTEFYITKMQISDSRFHFTLSNQFTKHLITKSLNDLSLTTITATQGYENETFIPISDKRVLKLSSTLPVLVKTIP